MRALYAAYDRVLADNGIHPDHDQIYFRFLLRMGGSGANNGSLLDRFKALLARMGIQIEVAAPGEALEEVTQAIKKDNENEGREDPDLSTDAPPTRAERPLRRVSFNDSNYENTWRSQNTSDPSPHPTQQPKLTRSATSWGTDYQTGKISRSDSRPRLLEQLPVRGRLTPSEAPDHNEIDHSVNSPQALQGVPELAASQAQQQRQKRRRSASLSSLGTRASEGFGNASDGSFDDQGLAAPEKKPPQYIYHPSDTRMLSDADILRADSSTKFLRRLLRRWRDMAVQQRSKYQVMEDCAISYDANILLHQGFDQWRITLVEKRQEKETERFFTHLERRAGKARDLFLLTKAFTHWAQYASEEVARTSVARRHILRTKYFNAWKEITAVNELKVRRQGLRKFMSIWRQRTAKALNDEALATAWYEERLVNRTGWHWWRLLLEHIAPELHARFVKRRFFYKWHAFAQERRQQESEAEAHYLECLQRKVLLAWKTRLQKLNEDTSVATQAYHKALVTTSLVTLHKQASLVPLAMQTSQAVDGRIVKMALVLWNLRMSNLQQAEVVLRQRLLRNVWTQWNDRLRYNILRRNRDDHALMHAMFRWMLAERCALFQRLAKINKCRSLFILWKSKTVDYSHRLQLAQAAVEQKRSKRLVTFALVKWHGESRRVRDLEHQALALSRPRLLQQSFSIWRERVDKVGTLSRMYSFARFYVLAKSSITRWRSATSNARRMRRREAYAAVRRQSKINVARRVLQEWQSKTAKIREWQAQAEERSYTTLVSDVRKRLEAWHSKTMSIDQLAIQAGQERSVKLLSLAYGVWKAKMQTLDAMQLDAEAYCADYVDTTAVTALKKWGLKVFQVCRLEESGKALWARSEEKRRRAMLRHWAERAIVKRGPLPGQQSGDLQALRRRKDEDYGPYPGEASNLFRSLHLGPRDDPLASSIVDTTGHPVPPSATARAERWTGFDDQINALDDANFVVRDQDLPLDLNHPNAPATDRQPTSTPLPGYLRSPSKRTARSRTRFRAGLAVASYTPAGTPHPLRPPVTPLGRRTSTPVTAAGMGEQRSGVTPFTNKLRGMYSDSRIPRRVVEEERRTGFEDIPEDRSLGARNSGSG